MAATSRLLLLASAAAAHKPHDEPPGSGWAAQLAKTHPAHPLARAAGAARGSAAAGGRAAVGAAPPPCPNPEWAEAAQPAGLLSVKLFGAQGNRTHDDAPAVRAAINASALCGGCVYFPPGEYFFGSTVVISGHGCFKGSAGHGSVDGLSPPSVNIYGPTAGRQEHRPARRPTRGVDQGGLRASAGPSLPRRDDRHLHRRLGRCAIRQCRSGRGA